MGANPGCAQCGVVCRSGYLSLKSPRAVAHECFGKCSAQLLQRPPAVLVEHASDERRLEEPPDMSFSYLENAPVDLLCGGGLADAGSLAARSFACRDPGSVEPGEMSPAARHAAVQPDDRVSNGRDAQHSSEPEPAPSAKAEADDPSSCWHVRIGHPTVSRAAFPIAAASATEHLD